MVVWDVVHTAYEGGTANMPAAQILRGPQAKINLDLILLKTGYLAFNYTLMYNSSVN